MLGRRRRSDRDEAVLRLRSPEPLSARSLGLLLLNLAFLVLTLKGRRFIEYWPVFALINAADLAPFRAGQPASSQRMAGPLKALAATLVIGGGSLVAQGTAPDLAFDTVADLLKTPNDVFVGEVGGVGANSKGQIFVYTRTGHPYATLADNRTFYRNGSRLFLFDQTGRFVREWGQDVYGFNAAFGLRIDPQDNVWTIDEGANQVVKFAPDGSISLVLGRKPEAIGVRPPPPPAPIKV